MTAPQHHSFERHPALPHLELRRSTHSCAGYQTHTHEEYAFGLIDSGTAIYSHGDFRTPVVPGMVVMMEPGLPHACNPDPHQSWSYRMLYVDAAWVQRLRHPNNGNSPQLMLARRYSADPAAAISLRRVFDALQTPTCAKAVNACLVDFLTNYALSPATNQSITVADHTALARAKALITSCANDSVSLQHLAQISGLSPYHLIRRFKLAYGQTPHAFQIDQRLNTAKKLLKQGQPLSDVALQTGFADQAHFQRHFKKRHAITPRAYLG